MKRIAARFIQVFAVLFLIAGATGCDTFEVFDRDKEVTGIVEEVGDGYLVVEGIRYEVNSKTEFEGDISGLSDISVGDEVGVEYKESSGTRTAVEIERGDEEDDDGGLLG